MTTRTRRRRLGAALALAALLAPASSVHAQTRAKPRPCPKSTVAKSSVAVLYRSGGETRQRLLSCHRRTRVRRVLATWFEEGSSTDQPAPQYWLAGRFAAVNQAFCSGDPTSPAPCVGTLKVVDVRTGRRAASVDTGDPLHDLVLRASGSVALIHRDRLIRVQGGVQEVLDTAAERYSLAYAAQAGRLYWTGGGQPRSAPLR